MNKVLISGAGSGLGEALAWRYARAGAEVCVTDINREVGERVAQSINTGGGSAFFIACDITQQEDVDGLAQELERRWGSLHILVNNAGVATAGKLEYENIEQWQWVLDINLLGHVRMTKAFVPLLRKSKSASTSIINIASQAGITAAPGMGSYCVTKAAMVSFSETLYLELAHDGIHVGVVCPAFFETNLNMSLRSGQPGMGELVTQLIKNSGVSADEIAEQVLRQIAGRKFMIVTHSDGRRAYRLKRFLPMEWYLKITSRRIRKVFGSPEPGNSHER